MRWSNTKAGMPTRVPIIIVPKGIADARHIRQQVYEERSLPSPSCHDRDTQFVGGAFTR
jgi:hypothetical protein